METIEQFMCSSADYLWGEAGGNWAETLGISEGGGGLMIISKKYALRLIREGKARKVGKLKPDPNDRYRVYVIVDRLDLQRTDHYLEG